LRPFLDGIKALVVQISNIDEINFFELTVSWNFATLRSITDKQNSLKQSVMNRLVVFIDQPLFFFKENGTGKRRVAGPVLSDVPRWYNVISLPNTAVIMQLRKKCFLWVD